MTHIGEWVFGGLWWAGNEQVQLFFGEKELLGGVATISTGIIWLICNATGVKASKVHESFVCLFSKRG
jgi:hypothetical protein